MGFRWCLLAAFMLARLLRGLTLSSRSTERLVDYQERGVSSNGGDNFTSHDWRHHLATWFLRTGVDLLTLMKLGGWSHLQSVQRYVEGAMDAAYKHLSRI